MSSTKRSQIAINPVAQLPAKTLLHECAHVTLGHTTEADFTDTERTPKNLREVEAEAVALLCCATWEYGPDLEPSDADPGL